MNQHSHEHNHKQQHGNSQTPWRARAHKDWKTWVVVGLMLAGMLMYVLTMDEAVQPGGEVEPAVPAAP